MNEKSNPQILFPVSLTIYDVCECEDKVQESIRAGFDAEINLANVAELDSAGMQWLMSFAERENNMGQRVGITRPSPVCVEQFRLMGLSDFTGAADD
ncbi:MAG TPA: hypothetical protein DIW64_01780 [Cellvibrio sp.]|nr:hypothetical protein [Cellvibrio sp.]